jgi:hypothetical protein
VHHEYWMDNEWVSKLNFPLWFLMKT